MPLKRNRYSFVMTSNKAITHGNHLMGHDHKSLAYLEQLIHNAHRSIKRYHDLKMRNRILARALIPHRMLHRPFQIHPLECNKSQGNYKHRQD